MVAGTNVGIVSKYPKVEVYDLNRKYTAKNNAPSTVAVPPHMQHQKTYFLMPLLPDVARKGDIRDR